MQSCAIICCSVLRLEVENILQKDYPHLQAIFLDSMLHMHPQRLQKVMDQSLAALGDRPCLLVYGDCHPHIGDAEQLPHCCRTKAVNCADLLMGNELYRTYRRRKAFIFLPEWTFRWREVFEKELGFSDPSLAREFMQDNRDLLLYLDTGLIPLPQKTLDEISEYFGMPIEILAVSLDPLRQTIHTALTELDEKRSDQ